MMRGGFPDIQWTLEEMVAEGDKVAARFAMRRTHRGTFSGVPPTGNKMLPNHALQPPAADVDGVTLEELPWM